MRVFSPSAKAKSGTKTGFAYLEALSDEEDGMEEVEQRLAASSFIEIDQSLYTNAILSMLSRRDNASTCASSFLLLSGVAFLQYVLSKAILSHVNVAMSWTPLSVKAKAMHLLYEDLRHNGRLEYLRLERKDVVQLCGDFEYNLVEKVPPGTNWTAYYAYQKIPVNNWHAWDIPPTDRSELDTARFVLENNEYKCVYIIVTFIWMLTIINEIRMILQFILAVFQLPSIDDPDAAVLERCGEDLQIIALTRPTKVVGFFCTLWRVFITLFISWVGCQFLLWTSTNIDLILNALTLTFVLELDHITYSATISSSRQSLIGNLKRLSWKDPTAFPSRYPNCSKMMVMLGVLTAGIALTAGLRFVQHEAYMDMFALTATICLFQGPTPGYWSKFRATFPAPGLCETVLNLRCESPIVGENGVPCVEDWDQFLCKYYVMQKKSMFNTWNNIDWNNEGPCLAEYEGKLYPVAALDFPDNPRTLSILGNVCQSMWQMRPSVIFRGKHRLFTGPRLRVYPYREFTPAAPFWCDYKEGSSAVLEENGPAPFGTWKRNLKNCKSTVLVYSDKSSSSWIATEQTKMEEERVGNFSNMTQATGRFGGIWLSKRLGVVVISDTGDEAHVSNMNMPNSPVSATTDGNTITIHADPPFTGTLSEDAGKIVLRDGDVWASQAAAAAEKKKNQKRPFPLFFR